MTALPALFFLVSAILLQAIVSDVLVRLVGSGMLTHLLQSLPQSRTNLVPVERNPQPRRGGRADDEKEARRGI
jgi:hypothetical protein